MRTISKVYGTLTTDKGVSTRTGNKFVKASAQSWDGSVSVEINNGAVRILVGMGSSNGGRELLSVPLEKLMRADSLVIEKEKV